MRAYSDAYLDEVVENQGKLFDYVAYNYSDKDTEDFINTYMTSSTRKYIDEAMAYLNTMDAKELWNYFINHENYNFLLLLYKMQVLRICYSHHLYLNSSFLQEHQRFQD